MGQLHLGLSITQVALELHAPHYRDMLNLASSVTSFRLRAPHAALRPACTVMAEPKLWWHYAIASVIADRRNPPWSYHLCV